MSGKLEDTEHLSVVSLKLVGLSRIQQALMHATDFFVEQKSTRLLCQVTCGVHSKKD